MTLLTDIKYVQFLKSRLRNNRDNCAKIDKKIINVYFAKNVRLSLTSRAGDMLKRKRFQAMKKLGIRFSALRREEAVVRNQSRRRKRRRRPARQEEIPDSGPLATDLRPPRKLSRPLIRISAEEYFGLRPGNTRPP